MLKLQTWALKYSPQSNTWTKAQIAQLKTGDLFREFSAYGVEIDPNTIRRAIAEPRMERPTDNTYALVTIKSLPI